MAAYCIEAPPWKKKILKSLGIDKNYLRSLLAFSEMATNSLDLWLISMTERPVP